MKGFVVPVGLSTLLGEGYDARRKRRLWPSFDSLGLLAGIQVSDRRPMPDLRTIL